MYNSLLSRLLLPLPLSLLLCASSLAQQSVAVGPEALQDDQLGPRFEQNKDYQRECGTCHIPYAPMLLPAESWRSIMAGLEDHFGDSAELDPATAANLSGYLNKLALEQQPQSYLSHWQQSLPVTPVLRITELPGFLSDHQDAINRLGEGSDEPGFFSPCKDCHKEAVEGIFDKERLFRGTSHLFNRFSGGN